MRIIFWNIMHGGGSRAGKIVEQILDWSPDVVALAEFRGTAPSQSIAGRLADAGLAHQLSTVDPEHPVWNAVFLASRFDLKPNVLSPPEAPYSELYWLTARVETTYSISMLVAHVPYSYRYGRREFYEEILKVAKNWQFGPAMVIGDMNTGMTDLDEETEYSEDYIAKVMYPLEEMGWRDPFRILHPDADAPTWFSPLRYGFRLDQAFANQELHASIISCCYDWGDSGRHGKLSDHAAILLELELPR